MSRLLLATIVATALSAVAIGQQVRPAGRGCCSGATPPTLDVNLRPGSLHAGGAGAPADAPGGLLVSPPPPAPTALGNGGFVFLDPTALLPLAPIGVGSDGSWGADVNVPPGVEVSELVVQAVFLDGGMSIGVALSDAVVIVF